MSAKEVDAETAIPLTVLLVSGIVMCIMTPTNRKTDTSHGSAGPVHGLRA